MTMLELIRPIGNISDITHWIDRGKHCQWHRAGSRSASGTELDIRFITFPSVQQPIYD